MIRSLCIVGASLLALVNAGPAVDLLPSALSLNIPLNDAVGMGSTRTYYYVAATTNTFTVTVTSKLEAQAELTKPSDSTFWLPA